VLELWVDESYNVKVNMGRVRTSPSEIPAKKRLWAEKISVKDREFEIYAVNTGVPHAVVFVDGDELERLDIIPIAREIRYSELFPEGTNVNFVSVAKDGIRVRTYERGVEDETLSCGTGSVASAFVSLKLGLASEPVRVKTKGGELVVEFGNGDAFMTGGAARVFDGKLRVSELRL
jgi:diaminopimelate epimerase